MAAAIWVDVKTAIYKPKLLTSKQMEVIDMIVNHQMTMETVGEYLSISKVAVHYRFDGAILKIQKLLLSGNLFYCDT